MTQLAQNSEAEVQDAVKTARRKARDQLRLLVEKRKREDEIRDRLAAFAEEMERARAMHAKLL